MFYLSDVESVGSFSHNVFRSEVTMRLRHPDGQTVHLASAIAGHTVSSIPRLLRARQPVRRCPHGSNP